MFRQCRAMNESEVYMADFTPEKSKQIALARLDVVHQWLEFRKKSKNKLQADYDFVKLHNTTDNYLFEILGKISRGSLHRWFAMLNGTEDYTKLVPQYKYSSPAIKIASELSKKYEHQVISVEPHIKSLPDQYKNTGIELDKLENALEADIIIPLVKHNEFIKIDFSNKKEKLVDYIGLV